MGGKAGVLIVTGKWEVRINNRVGCLWKARGVELDRER